jgi:hypothetical protein
MSASILPRWSVGGVWLDAASRCFEVSGPGAGGHPMTIGDVLLYPRSKRDLEVKLQEEALKRYEFSMFKDKHGRSLDPDFFGPDLLNHEAAHSEQWTHYSKLTFPVSYGIQQLNTKAYCGDWGICNKFEVTANPYNGSYWRPPVIVNGEWAPYPGTPDPDYVLSIMG